jgi:23S rRNA (cytosine1962-C5)-methyltransferase
MSLSNSKLKEINIPELKLLVASDWEDYELLDSGNGLRLEKIGRYRLIRPEHQAVWTPRLSQEEWDKADAIFLSSSEESGGHWKYLRPVEDAWKIRYKSLNFWARTSNSRHIGFFPEQSSHWDWIREIILPAQRPIRVLNLFGYTGIASLVAASAGAQVTHVDASKKTIAYARDNQSIAGLDDKPIRWIVDDAMKFVRREIRRRSFYDGLILDPPKFGRGPRGEVWEFFDALLDLMKECRSLISNHPLFFVITAYAVRASALSLYYASQDMMGSIKGSYEVGELILPEKQGDRALSMAIYTRWRADDNRIQSG